MVHDFHGIGIEAKLLTGRKVGVTSVTQDRGQYIVLIDYYDDAAYNAQHGKISRGYFYREEYHPITDFIDTSVMDLIHAFYNHPKKQQLEIKLPYLRINQKGTWSHANLASFGRSIECYHKEIKKMAGWLDEVAGIDPYASEEQIALLNQIRSKTKDSQENLKQIIAHLDQLGVDRTIS